MARRGVQCTVTIHQCNQWASRETLNLAKGPGKKVLTQPRCRKRNMQRTHCRWEPKASILRLLPRLVIMLPVAHSVIFVEPDCTSTKWKEDRRSRFPTTCASYSSSLAIGNRASACLFIRAHDGATQGPTSKTWLLQKRRPSRETRSRHTLCHQPHLISEQRPD